MDIHEWLSETKAADVMISDIVTFRASDSLSQAAVVLLHEQISGGPVVDDGNACVGVLTANDFVGAEGKAQRAQDDAIESEFFKSNLALPTSIYEERLAAIRDRLVPTSQQPIERFMTSNVVSVSRETPLSTILQQMVDAHVHRVLILDEQNSIEGIVSSTDVLAALLRADRTHSTVAD